MRAQMTSISIDNVEFQPAAVTLASLVRCGDHELEVMLGWVDRQRAVAEERRRADEARLRELHASMTKGMAQRHAAQAAWARDNL
jgi:hypothetical protein